MALAVSVLPTPVGPRSRNEPMGRLRPEARGVAPQDARRCARAPPCARRRARPGAPRGAACARRRSRAGARPARPRVSLTTSATCSRRAPVSPRRRARAPARSRMPTALSGSAALGHVAHAPRHAAAIASGREAYAVVLLERRRHPLEREDRLVGRQLDDLDRREAARERGVGVDDARLYSSTVVAPMHGELAASRARPSARRPPLRRAAEERVHLVEEEDDAPLGPRDLGLDLRRCARRARRARRCRR